MMTEHANNKQFHEWLLSYVNGQLDDVKTAWMEQYAAENPDAAIEVEIERALKNTLLNELPDYPLDYGLNTLMSRIRAEQGSVQPKTPVRRDSIVNHCIAALSGLFTSPKWAVAVTLLLLQTGVITTLLLSPVDTTLPEPYQWRSVTTPSRFQGPVLEITFKSASTEADIRLLLIKIRGSLLGGPGQLGKYLVKVPKDTIAQAQKEVMKSKIIESVQILPELPLEH